MPPAPVTLSTRNVCPNCLCSRSERRRAMMSGEVPGGVETMKRTGFCGHAWADALPARRRAAASAPRTFSMGLGSFVSSFELDAGGADERPPAVVAFLHHRAELGGRAGEKRV